MSSRVVHTRLPDQQIAQCYDLLERLQLEATGPPSSIIAQALAVLLAPLELPFREPADAAELIKERAKPVAMEPTPQLETFTPEELAEGETWNQIAPIPPPEVPPPPVLEQPPWEGHREIPFDLIQSECPKDRFVELALTGDPLDPFLVKAIEIAYVALGRDWWGSPKAEQLITELMQRFHQYADSTGETL